MKFKYEMVLSTNNKKAFKKLDNEIFAFLDSVDEDGFIAIKTTKRRPKFGKKEVI